MANNTISKSDKAKMFDYLREYQDTIKSHFGKFNYNNKNLQNFLSANDIYLGRLNQTCKNEAVKHNHSILFEQTKPHNQSNDIVHHLLRHLRNSIAHGRVSKKGNTTYLLEDKSADENTVKMMGEIDSKLFFKLIDFLKNT